MAPYYSVDKWKGTGVDDELSRLCLMYELVIRDLVSMNCRDFVGDDKIQEMLEEWKRVVDLHCYRKPSYM